ncbi:MAG: alpha/beta fold hydrolase [Thermoleophilaceae bacterium]|nr:alpha/beta fold hydrolase [Thermoleophilaceae bacterium]
MKVSSAMSVSRQLGEKRSVQVGEATIRYRESGSGRPVVFVHGFLVNGDVWRKVVPELAGDVRCIVPDWPLGAHEVAMPENADLSAPGVAKLIADFLESLDLDDVVLVGNDSGGALCQLVVTAHPERVGALVLTPCDCFEKFPPFPYNFIRYALNTPGARSLLVQSMRLSAVRYASFRPLMKSGYDGATVKSWAQPSIKDPGVRRDTVKFGTSLHPRVTKQVAGQLPDVEIPVLIAWSPECTFFKFELAERLAAALPNSRIDPIPGGWTFLAEDRPKELAASISRFAQDER